MIIAVDFDGTIVHQAYPEIGKVHPFAFETLKKFQQVDGDELILWTCRQGELLDAAVEFCKEHGLVFDAVNDNLKHIQFKPRKIFADWYIDDRANDGYINWKHIEMMRPVMESSAVQIVNADV